MPSGPALGLLTQPTKFSECKLGQPCAWGTQRSGQCHFKQLSLSIRHGTTVGQDFSPSVACGQLSSLRWEGPSSETMLKVQAESYDEYTLTRLTLNKENSHSG
jgi:hypothetical protein